MGGLGKFFKDAGHSISKGSKSIGHVFSKGAKKVEGAVSDVYHDGKSAVSYTGKHLIGDVDTLSSGVANSTMYFAIGGVAVVLIMMQMNNRR